MAAVRRGVCGPWAHGAGPLPQPGGSTPAGCGGAPCLVASAAGTVCCTWHWRGDCVRPCTEGLLAPKRGRAGLKGVRGCRHSSRRGRHPPPLPTRCRLRVTARAGFINIVSNYTSPDILHYWGPLGLGMRLLARVKSGKHFFDKREWMRRLQQLSHRACQQRN